MNLEDLSLGEMANQIRACQLSPVETVQTLLDRIARLDPLVHAWTTIDSERALNQARRSEEEIREGKYRSPLHGVPIGVKDIFQTQGMRTTMGSSIFEDYIPDHDATVVTRLKEAGAVVLGKTVTTEFATFDPGPTRNPWNLEHTPGGSSSGSAAAVASGMCPGATGTQTAGSIGRPAAYCGISALMPTASRISRDGVFPASWSLDHVGAFGRRVDDVRIMIEVMCGEPLKVPTVPPTFRVGVVRQFFEEKTEPAAWGHHETLIARLGDAEVPVRELSLPRSFPGALATLRTIMRTELAAAHEELHRQHADKYGPNIRGLIESGLLVSSAEYLRACRLRTIYQSEMARLFADCDVILSPGARGAAPHGIETTGDPILSAPWTLADFPTLSLPVALDKSGLPIGVQLSTAPFTEGPLFGIGRWFEQFVDFRETPGGL